LEAQEREVEYYPNPTDCPFRNWRRAITDKKTLAAIDARVGRFRTGNFGKTKSVGDGVLESIIDFGPGYRIYYGIEGETVFLLCGGDKSTQSKDIASAKSLWSQRRGQK
jgi:putative addiction module killer protein